MRHHETGVTNLGNVQYYYFFNWSVSECKALSTALTVRAQLMDFWTDQDLGVHEGGYTVEQLPPRSARLIRARPVVE